MFMLLMDGIACLIFLGLGFLALVFAGALLGRLIGSIIVAIRSTLQRIGAFFKAA